MALRGTMQQHQLWGEVWGFSCRSLRALLLLQKAAKVQNYLGIFEECGYLPKFCKTGPCRFVVPIRTRVPSNIPPILEQ